MKLREIIGFEIYYQIRRPSVWIFISVILGLVLLIIREMVGSAGLPEEELFPNSPAAIAEITGFASQFSLLLIAALVGEGALRDFLTRMDALVLTTPLRKFTYLMGRLLGISFVGALLMVFVVPVGYFIANFIFDQSLFGPTIIRAFLESGLFVILPNVFVSTAITFSMVLLFRKPMAAYLGAFIIFILSTLSLEIAGGNWQVAQLIDPFGITIIDTFRRSLTPVQMNIEHLVFSGTLIANRILWISISFLLVAIALAQFKLSYNGKIKTKISTLPVFDAPIYKSSAQVVIPVIERTFKTRTRILQTVALIKRFSESTIKSPTGLVIIAIAIYVYVLIPNMLIGPLDVPGLPSTTRILGVITSSSVELMVTLFITLIVGQIIWAERDARLDEIEDAIPIPTGITILSKYFSLALVLLILQFVLMATGILLQTTSGYDQFEIGRYLHILFGVQLPSYLLFLATAMALHVLINQKYVAHMAVLLFYLFTIIPQKMGISHKMLIFGSDTGWASSDFYGQGAFIYPWLLFTVYWIGWSLLMMALAKQAWVRGRETGLKRRLRNVAYGFNSPILIIGVFLILSAGGSIYYNTNILSDYSTADDRINRKVEYELLYGKFKNIPQPVLTATKLKIELFPEERKGEVKGIYHLKNNSNKALDSIHIAISKEVETNNIKFDRKAKLVISDEKLGHFIFQLEKPLQPTDSIQMEFLVRFEPKGFSNSGINTAVMDNGTYFQNKDWFPLIGYQPGRELSGKKLRADNGLPELPNLPGPENTEAVMNTKGQELIKFEATIGTAPNQIAIAPGTLKKTWAADGRKYFHYVANNPIRNSYHIYSANYEVKETKHDDITIRIFYHPQHTHNIESLESAAKASIAYYSKNFSPYQFDQIKVVEYPDLGTGGISLPGTIGYSTNFALLSSNTDHVGFDLPFAVTAHEVAHQWWGHQLYPALTEGMPLVSESLAWYSALNVVEKEKGKHHLLQLLTAMRNDYLTPRSKAAAPLIKTIDDFHGYRKGPLVMYALREYIGEEKVNLALQNFLNKFQPGIPPFATSLDLLNEFQTVTPDSLKFLLKDLFVTNTFWDLKTTGAVAKPTPNGNWLVTLEVLAAKSTVDEKGIETEIPVDDLIEIGIFGEDENGKHNPLYLEKQHIKSGLNTFQFIVSKKPVEAGIDPRNLLIDIERSDNVKQL